MAEMFHPHSTEKMFLILMDLLNKFYVDSKNAQNQIVPSVVPIRNTTASKILTFWRTDAINTVVPIIAIELLSLDFDETRAQTFPYQLRSRYANNLTYTPVPYNFSFSVSIFTKKVGMLFEIIEQIVPNYRTMRTYPLIEFKFTDGSEIKRDVPVILNSTAFEVQSEWQKDDVQLYYASLGFMLKGFIYQSYYHTGGAYTGDSGSTGKFIEDIDIQFENYQSYLFETMSIFERYETGAATGADPIIVKEVTGNV